LSWDPIRKSLAGLVAGSIAQIPYIVLGILVFLAFVVVARIIRRIFVETGARTRFPLNVATILGRLASSAVIVLGGFVAAVVVFPAFKPGDLVTGLGITSVAIGFAFKDVLQNFFAGILILWRQPFVVGDQIRVRDYEGTVEEINMRSTRILTYDGERAVLPNGDVYVNPILVRTAYAHRRIRFSVGIGYSDSIEQARTVIQGVLARTDGVLPQPRSTVYLTELAGSSVNFTVFFWTKSTQSNVLAVSDRVATGIKLALDEARIDMPFPHTVVLFHDQTGNRHRDIGATAGAANLAGPRARAPNDEQGPREENV
jgi:small conductance mechanosensitive channel